MKKGLLVLLLCLVTFFANARKLYVSSSYTDSVSNGALATPWKSLANVQSNLGNIISGDSVLFKKGDKFSGTLIISNKTNVYFGVYGTGADPLFWGDGNTISELFKLRNCNNVTFYGWSISDTTISFTDRYTQAKIQTVFQLENSSTNNVFRKCTMDRIGYGIYFNVASNSNTIDSCDIGNLRMIRNTPRDTICKVTRGCNVPAYCLANPGICDSIINNDDDYGGVPVQFSSKDNIFTNNYLHDCWSQSFDYGYDGGGVEFFEEGDSVNRNRIMYNTFYDCNGIFEFGSNTDGVVNNPQANNIIAYNKVINSSSLIYINNNGQYRTKVTNLQIYNNVYLQTIASRTGDSYVLSMAIEDLTAGIVVMKNNIFQVSNGASIARSGRFTGSNLTHTNNIYKLSNGSVTNFTLNGTELSTSGIIWKNTTNSDPLYWNYSLTSTSPAINKGVDVSLTRDFNNQTISNPPDAGVLNSLKLSLISSSGVTCKTATDGAATIQAVGGTAPYQYRLNNLIYRSSGVFSGLAPNTYAVIVKDVIGTIFKLNVTIRGSKTVCP
jgi:hypothetical protein